MRERCTRMRANRFARRRIGVDPFFHVTPDVTRSSSIVGEPEITGYSVCAINAWTAL